MARKETPHYDDWFTAHGYTVQKLPELCVFEGAGDALMLRETVIAGYRYRSDICSHTALAQITGLGVLSLELIDPQYYHLDTCFCPLGDDAAIYYPAAFDSYANQVIEANIPNPIAVTEAEAHRFACNAVVVGKTVVMNAGCPELEKELQVRGYTVRAIDLSEFMKAGGSAKCLTLALD